MKRLYKTLLLFIILLASSKGVKSQVLISLLFGDALNSEKVEFGLIGGMNRSFIHDIDGATGLNNFNIGFYFHLTIMTNSYISTGVLVKSNVGAKGMPTYLIGDPDFDNVFANGELTKKISYFYVPILFQQRFNQLFYLEGGVQLGLRNKADDIFTLEAYGGDLKYQLDVRDQYSHFDGGLQGGFGFKLHKRPKSMSIGSSYYYGLINVSKVADVTIKNSSVYFWVRIPIGAGKKADDK